MPERRASFIDCKSWNPEHIFSLFRKASELRGRNALRTSFENRGLTAALLFFEPSTRTRMSFQTACLRLGLNPIILDTAGGTSLEKGESVEDSILNVAAMGPEVLIIRAGDGLQLEQIAKQLPCPIVNAGWGKAGHPTQALLDTFTLYSRWGGLEKKKLLIVGDIKHSRVAASHFELAPLLGLQIAVCGPKEFIGTPPSHVSQFDSLKAGLEWADAVMMLRFQFERHSEKSGFASDQVRRDFGLTEDKLHLLRPEQWVLHPGPINHGIEMDQIVMGDSRSLVLEQVHNGTWIRQALLWTILQDKVVSQ